MIMGGMGASKLLYDTFCDSQSRSGRSEPCFLAKTICFWNVYCSSANVKNKYELLHLRIFQHVMYIIHPFFFRYDFPGVLNQ